jgi:hypothetical protein
LSLDPDKPREIRRRLSGSVLTPQPTRTKVGGTEGGAIRVGHVKAITSPTARVLPVRLLARSATSPWDGLYVYRGETQEFPILPPYDARDFLPLQYAGNDANAQAPAVELVMWEGQFHVRHPNGIQAITPAQLEDILQRFDVTDGRPVPLF